MSLSRTTDASRLMPRVLMAPAVASLFLWMIVPLGMTIVFALMRYNLLQPGREAFVGLDNFTFFLGDPSFTRAILNTLLLIGGVIVLTVVLGIGLALLVDSPFPGRGIVRVMLISPFFIMPTVNALMWKHMMMNPIYGLLARLAKALGLQPIDFVASMPLASVTLIVAWQWLPFACLIFITSLQSLDREQIEAAHLDGATYAQRVWYLYLPHLGRSIAVVVMIEMIFLLGIFAEIAITTGGGPGDASTNLTFLIYKEALLNFDAGTASAGALVAVVLANIVAAFLIRLIGKSLDR
jgi:sorbitol/mannitol transport system permease protein